MAAHNLGVAGPQGVASVGRAVFASLVQIHVCATCAYRLCGGGHHTGTVVAVPLAVALKPHNLVPPLGSPCLLVCCPSSGAEGERW